MFLLLSILLGALPEQANPANQIAGTWLNQDPSTMGIPQIVISDRDGGIDVHAWGACVPTDCDWGITELHFADGVATAVFDMGFASEKMYLVRLPSDKLLAVSKTEFKDGSDRHDMEHSEIFVRSQEDQGAEATAAKNVLKKVAETYRELSAAQFEWEDITEGEDQVTSTRVNVHFSQPDRSRVETVGTGESKTLISDGHTSWTFYPEANEYTSHPAAKQRPFPLHSYGLLDQTVGLARITGSERLGDKDCVVVAIGRPNQTRTFWVDSATNFVYKDRIASSSRTTGLVQRSETIRFSLARSLTNVDEQLFSFDPDKRHSKARSELQKQALVKSVGSPAPEFSLSDLEGKEIKLSQLRGKAVLLDFWATKS